MTPVMSRFSSGKRRMKPYSAQLSRSQSSVGLATVSARLISYYLSVMSQQRASWCSLQPAGIVM